MPRGSTFIGTLTAIITCCGLGATFAAHADFNMVDGITVADIFAFLSAWFAGSPAADFNGTGGITVADIFAFLTAWFAGCA